MMRFIGLTMVMVSGLIAWYLLASVLRWLF